MFICIQSGVYWDLRTIYTNVAVTACIVTEVKSTPHHIRTHKYLLSAIMHYVRAKCNTRTLM